MFVRVRTASAAGALALLAGCGAGEPDSGALVVPTLGPGAPRPDSLRVSWLDGRGYRVRDRTVEVPGGEDSRLPTLFVEARSPGPRRVVVRAVAGGEVVAEGAARVSLTDGTRTRVLLPLGARRLPDGDGDGLPDAIDDCPRRADEGQCADAPLAPESDGKVIGPGWHTVSAAVSHATADAARAYGMEVFLALDGTSWSGRIFFDEMGWK